MEVRTITQILRPAPGLRRTRHLIFAGKVDDAEKRA
jgi:hypothetical protein